MFMYPSWLTKYPLYSKPHFNLTQTCLPVKSCKNGFGLTGWICARIRIRGQLGGSLKVRRESFLTADILRRNWQDLNWLD